MSSSIELKHVRPLGDGAPNPSDITDHAGGTDNNANGMKKRGHINEGYVSHEDSAAEDGEAEVTEEVIIAYVSEPLDDDLDPNSFSGQVKSISDSIHHNFEEHSQALWRSFYAIVLALYIAYFIGAMLHSFGDEGSIRLLWVTCVVVFCVCLHYISKCCKGPIQRSTQSMSEKLEGKSKTISWTVVGIIWAAIIIFVIVDISVISKNPYNAVPLSGIIIYTLLLYIFSYARERVNWLPVAWGLALQFILAIFILKWKAGYAAFQWIVNRVSEFLTHSDAGASFIFGGAYEHHLIAFKILPQLIFFSTVISVLYYFGAMQFIINIIARIMHVTMGTTAAESFNAVVNIFVGQMHAPLFVRPMVRHMTRSELHAIMTGSFANIALSSLLVYELFIVYGHGLPVNHLVAASVMSAPVALAMAKLFYPETEKTKPKADVEKIMEKKKDLNLFGAMLSGAQASIPLIANIVVNVIATIAITNFLNETVRWFCARIGWILPIGFELDRAAFETILSYLLWPFAFTMGTDSADCRTMARLIGIKIVQNEIDAYAQLKTVLENKEHFDLHLAMNGTYQFLDTNIILEPNATALVGGVFFSERSPTIAIYALCNFASFGAIGYVMGGLTALAPNRASDIASVVLRAFIVGNLASFMTASCAGLFFQPA